MDRASRAGFLRNIVSIVEMTDEHLDAYTKRPVIPQVTQGYLKESLGANAPTNPVEFDQLKADLAEHLLPGMYSCHHPHANAYIPIHHSKPAILASLTQSMLASYATNWMSNPGLMELEMLMCDWYAEAVGLPTEFTFSSKTGGGVLLMSATEGLLMSAVAARDQIAQKSEETGKVLMYTSAEGHSGVEKVAKIMGVHVKRVESELDGGMDPQALINQIKADRKNGFNPFICVATIGTVLTLQLDNLEMLGSVCSKEQIWLHVDGTYGGNFCICPEYRYMLNGVTTANSIVISPQKANIAVGYCSCLWLKNIYMVESSVGDGNPMMTGFFNLGGTNQEKRKPPQFVNLQLPTAKTSLALGLLFSFRLRGISGIQGELRSYVSIAKKLGSLAEADSRFELAKEITLGIVCFRLKNNQEGNIELVKRITDEGKVFLMGVTMQNMYTVRFINNFVTSEEDVCNIWSIIQKRATDVMAASASQDNEIE